MLVFSQIPYSCTIKPRTPVPNALTSAAYAILARPFNQTLDTVVASIDPVLLLHSAIFDQALEEQPKVSRQGVLCMDKCLRRLEAENALAAVLGDGLNTESLVRALAKGAASKVQGVKQAARDGVTRWASTVVSPPDSSVVSLSRCVCARHGPLSSHGLLSTL